MRRVHLRGHDNVLKRLLLHAGALNLGLLMRHLVGIGTPRSLQDYAAALLSAIWVLIRLPETLWDHLAMSYQRSRCLGDLLAHRGDYRLDLSATTVFTTGC